MSISLVLTFSLQARRFLVGLLSPRNERQETIILLPASSNKNGPCQPCDPSHEQAGGRSFRMTENARCTLCAPCWIKNHVHLLTASEMYQRGPWAGCLALEFAADQAEDARLRSGTTTGRPCGDLAWVRALERQTGRAHLTRPRGRPRLAGGGLGEGESEPTDLFGGQ